MKSLLSVIGVVILFVYVIGSGLWVNTGDNWYRSLNQPPWQPPDFIFGLIWPYNFVILGFASVAVANKLSTANAVIYLSIFALSVAAALTWAYQFYRPHNLYAASIALAVVALLTLPMLYFIYQASVPLFFATTVYQVWVITATYLSYNYAKLN
jgi:translocator protein|uniref:TspO/MBR family protein n=2 Tax=Candidatus Nanopelagicus sp. TaxID=2518620 RepID=UPI00404B3F74